VSRFRAALRPLLVAALALAVVLGLARPAQAVVLWHAYRGAEQQALDQVVDDFRRAHPGEVVEVLALPFDAYASKLEAAIPHGHGPDVFLDAHERLVDGEVHRGRRRVARGRAAGVIFNMLMITSLVR